jgi:FkbM family methyltransferase
MLIEEYYKYEHIKLYNNALSNIDNKTVILVKNNHTDDDGSYSVYNEERETMWSENNLVNEVNSISIETIINDIGGIIDYLKIDCECGEYDGLLNKPLESIKYIGIEMHGQLGKEKFQELYEYISRTHTSNTLDTYYENCNVEMFFTNKSL